MVFLGDLYRLTISSQIARYSFVIKEGSVHYQAKRPHYNAKDANETGSLNRNSQDEHNARQRAKEQVSRQRHRFDHLLARHSVRGSHKARELMPTCLPTNDLIARLWYKFTIHEPEHVEP